MNTIRIILGVLLAIIALNAFGGGYYGMAGANNVPLYWLEGSPFKSYFYPSLFLFSVIGGACTIAAIAVLRNSIFASTLSFICAVLLMSWIIVQIAIIGYVSWMQPAIATSSIAIFILALLYRKQRRVNKYDL